VFDDGCPERHLTVAGHHGPPVMTYGEDGRRAVHFSGY
jgi:hypothetical protein